MRVAKIKKQTTRQRLYACTGCGQKIRAATDTLIAIHQCADGQQNPFALADGNNIKPITLSGIRLN